MDENPATPDQGASHATSDQQPPIKGLTYQPNEFLVAVEGPGAIFWILAVILSSVFLFVPLVAAFFVSSFGAGIAVASVGLVLTAIFVLPMFLVSGGRRYVITNRRSLVISFFGKLRRQMPHGDLDDISLTGYMGAPQVSLRLTPKKDSGSKKLTFGLCGPMGGMSRLWGTLLFWLRADLDIDQAPAVDAKGEVIDPDHNLDMLLLSKCYYRKGFDIQMAQRRGVTVMTPQRLMWLREEDFGSSGKVYASIPVEKYIISIARRANDAAEVAEALRKLSEEKVMAEGMVRPWDKLTEVGYSRMKGLHYVDSDGKKATVIIPGKYQESVKKFLSDYVTSG
jgi:hypothetical protein